MHVHGYPIHTAADKGVVETNFEVKPLPKARIPIIKLTLNPSPGLPYGTHPMLMDRRLRLTPPPAGIACDIGFENRLALENTRLLLTYATIDPARIRTLVLFREFCAVVHAGCR